MLDWTKISQNPTDPIATQALLQYLDRISQVIYRPWKDSHLSFKAFRDAWMFQRFGKSSTVLDIGFADHTLSADQPEWRHGTLRQVVQTCVGIDINSERVEAIRRATGLNNLVAADFSQNPQLPYLKFDGIFAGDLIEHLSCIDYLLDFIKQKLDSSGIAILTTPNCYGRHGRLTRKRGTVIDNLEHTCWISPFQMNELCRRKGLTLAEIIYFREGRKRILANQAVPGLRSLEFRTRDLWTDEYTYILTQVPQLPSAP
jgi:2-polyprenyl-3-methyl-5-hydroxy-6-metoxy-1,4-benzoquinol methylase